MSLVVGQLAWCPRYRQWIRALQPSPALRGEGAFTGLVLSESSSGQTQARGHITKTGNVHIRRVLVKPAHSYRFRPSLQGAVRRRLMAVPQWEGDLRTIS